MGESRTKNSIRNIIFSITAYLIQIILGFLVRRYFIYYFNEEFLGLNSLFSNILSVLSLAELGVGGAIVFSMYKPMAEGDKEKVSALLNFYKKCYLIIGCIVLVLGLCVIPFMGYFKAKAPQVDVNLYMVYLIFLINSVLSYFFAHRRALLYTDQRQDIESKINILINLLQASLQLVVILVIKNFYVYLLCTSLSTLLSNTFVFLITNKKYGEYIKKSASKIDDTTKKEITKNVYAMLFHKIGGVVVFSTDSILIYLLIGASQLGRYSNYALIISCVTSIITLYVSAIKGGIGNSIASRDEKENYKLLNKLNFAHLFIVAFCSICIFVLSDPFINTVLTKDANTSLLLDMGTVLALCLSFYLTQSRSMIGTFKDCAGLFYQDRFKPVFEVVVNLVTSIVLAKWLGLVGIVLGTIISTVSAPLWIEPYVLNKYYYKQNTGKYMLKYLMCLMITMACGVATYFVCALLPIGGVGWLVLRFAVCGLIAGITLFAGFMIVPEFRQSINWGKQIVVGILHRKRKIVVNAECLDEIDNMNFNEFNELSINRSPNNALVIAEELASINENSNEDFASNEVLEVEKETLENDTKNDNEKCEIDVLQNDEKHIENSNNPDVEE